MPDTGAPWNIPYVAGTDLVADWPTDNQTMAEAIADALDTAALIKQMVQTVKTDWFSTTSTSFVDVTGLSVTITPSSATSKILVIANCFIGASSSSFMVSQLVRDSTAIYVGTESVANVGTTWLNTASLDPRLINDSTSVYLDSPSTTSATTYKVQFKASSGATAYLNRAGHAADNSFASSITAIEVAA